MKPATAKAKGRDTENRAVKWLHDQGWTNAERRRLQGVEDQGDIAGIPGVCVEVKSAASWRPQQWIRELEVEIENSGAEIGFIMARPKGQPDPDSWVIIMPPWMLSRLLHQAEWLP